MKCLIKRIVLSCIAMALVFCSPALASSSSISSLANEKDAILRASYYLSSYAASTTSSGTTVSVNFNVTATGRMDYVGSNGIYIYESSNGSTFDCVRIFYPSGNSQMLKTNSQFNAGSVTYTGIKGYYYYAVVNFYAQNSSGSDTRNYTTTTIRL